MPSCSSWFISFRHLLASVMKGEGLVLCDDRSCWNASSYTATSTGLKPNPLQGTWTYYWTPDHPQQLIFNAWLNSHACFTPAFLPVPHVSAHDRYHLLSCTHVCLKLNSLLKHHNRSTGKLVKVLFSLAGLNFPHCLPVLIYITVIIALIYSINIYQAFRRCHVLHKALITSVKQAATVLALKELTV